MKLIERFRELLYPATWLPIHPEWRVGLLRKGESHCPGDFQLSGGSDGEGVVLFASWIAPGDAVPDTGVWFRYERVSLGEIVAWYGPVIARVRAEEAAKQEEACAKLRRLVFCFDAVRGEDPAEEERQRREIVAFIDENDFGCCVQFNANEGYVRFGRAGEEIEEFVSADAGSLRPGGEEVKI